MDGQGRVQCDRKTVLLLLLLLFEREIKRRRVRRDRGKVRAEMEGAD